MTDEITRKSFLRPQAEPTGTVLDFIRIEVPCPHCGEKDLQRLADLVVNDTTGCRYCGGLIRLDSESWKARLADEKQKAMEIKKLRP